MKPYEWNRLSQIERKSVLNRPKNRRDPVISERVSAIFDDIEARGFEALTHWAVTLDGHAPRTLELTPMVVSKARERLAKDDLAAMELAISNVEAFHTYEYPAAPEVFSPQAGVFLQRQYRPITTAGLYIPGGTAALVSTLIMTAIPAKVAGVPNRLAITPPDKDGEVTPIMVAAASACGLERLTVLGGAHGIAALALGLLEGASPADKLFGPGNKYVTEAKRLASERVSGLGIDMPAGPSELMVIADANANPAFIAADLLSQAEHDTDAQVVLVITDKALLEKVASRLEEQLSHLPRQAIARAALEASVVLIVDNVEQAAEVANLYAPEHLCLHLEKPDACVALVRAAGTIFAGSLSAETFGDYVCGPSHVLPTDGAARAFDGLSVRSFLTSFVVQTLTLEGLQRLAPAAARLARLEGLEAHARAADIRLMS